MMDPVKINLEKYQSLFTGTGQGYVSPGRILRANKKWRKKPTIATNTWTHFPRAVCEQIVTHYQPELMAGKDDITLRYVLSKKRAPQETSPLGVVESGVVFREERLTTYREQDAILDSIVLPQPLTAPWRNPANAEKVCELLCVAARMLFPRKIRVRALRLMCTPFLSTDECSPGFLRLSKLTTLAGKCYKHGSREFDLLIAIWATHVPRYTQMLFSGGEYQAFGLRFPDRRVEHFKGQKAFYQKDGTLKKKPPIHYTWDSALYEYLVISNETFLVDNIGLQ